MANTEELLNQLKAENQLLQDKLKASSNAFLNVIGRNRDGMLILDETGRIRYANPAVLDLFGKDLGELLGENIGIFIDTDKVAEITIIHKDRGEVVIEVNIADIIWEEKPAKLASIRDVTEHKRIQRTLQRLSQFDYLTDLSNRVYFERSLKKAMARAERIRKKVTLFFLDMDGFKQVNDTYGHQIGDQLLVVAAHILKSSVREEDVVSRLGGDEFAIVFERIEDHADVAIIAKYILKKISEPIFIEGHEIHVNFSIGIASYPENAENADELIKKADTAMYVAKNSGKGRYHFFDEVDDMAAYQSSQRG